jgi:tRNA G46 methylase TrmB
VTALRRTLAPGGTIELITDVADTFALAQRYLNADRGLRALTTGRAAPPSTSFARKARMRGVPIYLSLHRKSG